MVTFLEIFQTKFADSDSIAIAANTVVQAEQMPTADKD